MLLEVDNVVKHFVTRRGMVPWRSRERVVHAVDGVSMSINKGETVALVGESGCGKSTLGNLVLDLAWPDSGQIRFSGEDISKLSSARQRRYRQNVQAVFQDPSSSLDPGWTVGRLIAEPMVVAKTHSATEAAAAVLRLLEEVGLDPSHGQRYPHQFSGGQRQRIAIACAIATRPELIVLDEPVSALDVSVRAGILNLLRLLQRRYQIAYLFISHDLAAVRFIAHRVVVMYLGEIMETGPTAAVFDDPLHPYTKALLAASKALSIDNAANVDSMGWRHGLYLLDGDIPSPANPPQGCRFHTRCPHATEMCGLTKPAFTQAPDGRFVSACVGCVTPKIEDMARRMAGSRA